jgi:hypothetical protein
MKLSIVSKHHVLIGYTYYGLLMRRPNISSTEPHAPRLAESKRSMSLSFLALRNHCHLDWLIPSARTTPTPALISIEKSETMELMLTSCGHCGRGLSWCAWSVAMRPASDNNAKIMRKCNCMSPLSICCAEFVPVCNNVVSTSEKSRPIQWCELHAHLWAYW